MSFVLEQVAQKLDQCCQQKNSFHDLLDSYWYRVTWSCQALNMVQTLSAMEKGEVFAKSLQLAHAAHWHRNAAELTPIPAQVVSNLANSSSASCKPNRKHNK
jgi:hypothetical protein